MPDQSCGVFYRAEREVPATNRLDEDSVPVCLEKSLLAGNSFDGPDLLRFSVLVGVSDDQDFLAWVDVDQAA